MSASESDERVIDVGIDDGYAAIKLAWNDQSGQLMTFSIPSRARQGSLGVGSLTSDQTVGGYRTEGICFTVAPGIEGEETRFPDYNMSPLARVLSHHALVCAGFAGRSVRIASGLPLDRYFRNGKKTTKRSPEKSGIWPSRSSGWMVEGWPGSFITKCSPRDSLQLSTGSSGETENRKARSESSILADKRPIFPSYSPDF